MIETSNVIKFNQTKVETTFNDVIIKMKKWKWKKKKGWTLTVCESVNGPIFEYWVSIWILK